MTYTERRLLPRAGPRARSRGGAQPLTGTGADWAGEQPRREERDPAIDALLPETFTGVKSETVSMKPHSGMKRGGAVGKTVYPIRAMPIAIMNMLRTK